VDGFPVHAVIVGSKIIAHDTGTDTDHRVDGKPSTLRVELGTI
jgi:hypothetical protein